MKYSIVIHILKVPWILLLQSLYAECLNSITFYIKINWIALHQEYPNIHLFNNLGKGMDKQIFEVQDSLKFQPFLHLRIVSILFFFKWITDQEWDQMFHCWMLIYHWHITACQYFWLRDIFLSSTLLLFYFTSGKQVKWTRKYQFSMISKFKHQLSHRANASEFHMHMWSGKN